MNNDTGAEDAIPEAPTKGTDDGFLAICILVVTLLIVGLTSLYFFGNKNKSTGTISEGSLQPKSFTPPPGRANYIAARRQLNPSVPQDFEILKKLLMQRAIQAIPILLSIQNEGSSIERLYKRGMLTDDIYFEVKARKDFVDQEYHDVQMEAEELDEKWSGHIWPQAMHFYQIIQKQQEEKQDEASKVEDTKKKARKEKVGVHTCT
jgi:hypothetical protein